jgi:hypothetical protein
MIPYTRIALLFALLPTLVHAGGEEIIVIDTAKAVSQGELLAVRSGEIVLSLKQGASEKDLRGHPEFLKRIPMKNIAYVETKGHSHILLGAGIGLLVGMSLGGAIGLGAARPDPQVLGLNTVGSGADGIAIGGLVGLVGGLVVGVVTSSGDQHLDSSNPIDYAELFSLARYQGTEPEFLKSLK